ncbi:MAG: amino acid ABC transporter ATP-binding protein [Gallionellales bacterium RIFCSPLOWO2_12_FULL_59_22]|nr:MAG: amino acid ABC transporter ATP-binding protein [Gallionellales bacterium RIFCSPLOWO2_02_FULL_59_110]OGT14065.1 MAG: amino acid ABC transporter ATP-binding protein [Gallionellales bacterium RIFCSPLOWO2_12_FULL_59_22]
MALIEIRDLVKKFDRQVVLDGINLDVVEGEVKVVMGTSGCGKSTLLRCINRLVEPSSGTIHFRGQDITGHGVDVRALRQSIGFVFQQFALYRHLTVLDNVTLALRKLRGMSRAEAEEKALHELARLDMADHRDKYPAQTSGGQKQRAALARALAMDPAVVVLDEPTSALDPVMSREVAQLIDRLHRENVTMLCVTHDLLLAGSIADRVTFLDKGVIRAEDTIAHLSKHHPDEQVRAFFGCEENAR